MPRDEEGRSREMLAQGLRQNDGDLRQDALGRLLQAEIARAPQEPRRTTIASTSSRVNIKGGRSKPLRST